MSKKHRFGLVGCGRISKNHFEALTKNSDCAELVAVCDTDESLLRAATAELGVKGFKSLTEMLRETSIDVVTLCTPSGLHSEQAISCAQAGRHIITEKPMATRWGDALKMVEACEKHKVQLFVVKQNRLNPTLQLLKRQIENGRFGRIFMVNVNVFWTRPQSYYDQAPWRGTMALDGGAFMNQGSHYVDLLHWLFGPVESLQAYTATLDRKIEMEDTGVVGLKWKSGALGSMNVTMLTYPRNLEGSITIIGQKGTVKVGGLAVNEIQHWEFSDPSPDDELVKSASYETTSLYGYGHSGYYRNVLDNLNGLASSQTDGREGLKSLELLVAIHMSAKEGRRVSLPFTNSESKFQDFQWQPSPSP